MTVAAGEGPGCCHPRLIAAVNGPGHGDEVGPSAGGAPHVLVEGAIAAVLAGYMAMRAAELDAIDVELGRLGRAVVALVDAGGKRLRPTFVYWGHRSAGCDHDDAVLTAAAAVELFHVFALLQDDVMDGSETRRGHPTAHHSFAGDHRAGGHSGDADQFGASAAVLAGDLAAVWANQLFDSSALSPDALLEGRAAFSTLQAEVIAGQYLELWTSGEGGISTERTLQVALLKSGRYTVTRPLQIGAAIGGAGPAIHAALASYGDNLGLAFQLKDDILGLFGDPEITGKSATSDLREGKQTMLIAEAGQRATAAERAVLLEMLGDPDLTEADTQRARSIIERCGALAAVERLVTERGATALRALDGIPQPARGALAGLVRRATERFA